MISGEYPAVELRQNGHVAISKLSSKYLSSPFLRRHLPLGILIVAAGLILAICAVRLPGIAADDSFIHRRIANNYQHLGKPYFNPDQRVMVTSSPLWTLLLAATGALLPLDNPVPLLEFGFVLLSAAAAYELVKTGQPEGLSGVVLPVAAFCYAFMAVLPSSMEQMESPCAVALMLAGCLGILRKKDWGMPLLVLACFTRYECFPLWVLAGVWMTFRRQWTRLSLLASTAIGVAGLTWLLWEYGTVIPNTVVAKSHLYAMTYRNVVRAFASIPQALTCLAFGLLWARYGKSRGRQSNQVAFLLCGFGAFLAAAYLVRKTFIFSWYLPLVLAPLSIGILLWSNGRTIMPAFLGIVFAGMLLLPVGMLDMDLLLAALRGLPGATPDYALAARVHAYRRIGTVLHGECPTGILMTSEIGALGWAFQGEIRDGAGLASPEAIHYHPMRVPEERRSGTLGEIPAGFVRDRRPDMIVSYDLLAESALPAARSLGYFDYAYPLFVRADRASAGSLWEAQQMHVLVAPNGRCSPIAIDQAVRSALEE